MSGMNDCQTNPVNVALFQNGVASGISRRPTQTLYGHDDEVTAVAISSELDMAVSGSKVRLCLLTFHFLMLIQFFL